MFSDYRRAAPRRSPAAETNGAALRSRSKIVWSRPEDPVDLREEGLGSGHSDRAAASSLEVRDQRVRWRIDNCDWAKVASTTVCLRPTISKRGRSGERLTVVLARLAVGQLPDLLDDARGHVCDPSEHGAWLDVIGRGWLHDHACLGEQIRCARIEQQLVS